MDQGLSTLIAAAVPTLAIIVAFVRNETALSALTTRISSLESRLDARIETLDRDLRARLETLDRDFRTRIETLDRDLRGWAKIAMTHNTDIALLKQKAGLE